MVDHVDAQTGNGRARALFRRLISSLMLHPGGPEVAELVVVFRYIVTVSNLAIFAYVETRFAWEPGFVLTLVGIQLATVLLTLAIRATAKWRPARLPQLLVAAFLSDVALEVAGLMASGQTNGAFAAIPLLTLVIAVLALELRHALVVLLGFGLFYPLAMVAVRLGHWPLPTDLDPTLSADRAILFATVQVSLVAVGAVPFMLVVSELRGLYRAFDLRLQEAVARIETEVRRRAEEREVAARKLSASEFDYQLLANNVTDVVTVVDGSLGLVYASPSARAALGREPSGLVGTSLQALVHPEDWAEGADLLRSVALGASQAEFTLAHRLRHADGRWRWFETQGRRMPPDPSGASRVVLSSRDVTPRRELEERMRQTQKMESLGVLASGVAHDFNNILTSILGYSLLVTSELAPDSPLRSDLRLVINATKRASQLCDQMLTYAGRGDAVSVPLKLNQILEEMPALLGAAVPKQSTLSVELAPHLPCVRADVSQVRQVAMNLIINAAQAHGEHGGTVVASTGAMDAGAFPELLPGQFAVEHGVFPLEGRYVYLEVADDGCGMEPATLRKIFDPFFTTKATGRGLGLAAVLGIVSQHKGFIRVVTQPGRGTTMRVGFPASDAGVLEGPRTGASELSAWTGSGRVLLVDDEEEVVRVASQMLGSLGFEVVAARDGAAALLSLREHAHELVFVLSDVTMPACDGIDFFLAAHREFPAVPIALMSGLGQAAALERRIPGPERPDLLRKPFTMSALADLARRLCDAAPSSPRTRA